MRERLGTAAIVVALVVAWGGGFLWFRGDLDLPFLPSKGDGSPASASRQPVNAPKVTEVEPTVGASDAEYDGKVTLAQERRAVDINPRPQRPAPIPLPPVADWRMASFNILGSSHTNRGGKDAGMASGPARIGGVLELIGRHQVSVVGFQEMQGNQRGAFLSRAAKWALYPNNLLGNSGENSIGWNTEVWDLVKPAAVPIPYFNGNVRQMPYILLRHKATGVQAYFSNFHNPATTRKFRNQERFRAEATRRETRLFQDLQKTGIPVFATGDFNERGEFFCPVAAATGMISASGSRVVPGGGCQLSRPVDVDWILGSGPVVFDGFVADRSALVGRTSDHPMISTHVVVDSLKFKAAYSPIAPAQPTPDSNS